MHKVPYLDRAQAGRTLAMHLYHLAGRDDLLILALPRGGVPVAAVVADALEAPLDVLLVRKVGAPGRPELAMGAVASGAPAVLNRSVVVQAQVSDAELTAALARERAELVRREQLYRGQRPPPLLVDRTVVLIDDGLATGASMRAAIRAARECGPARLIAAAPVAAPDAVAIVRRDVDEWVCPATPTPFDSVGGWYVDFEQLSDAQVCEQLQRAWAPLPTWAG